MEHILGGCGTAVADILVQVLAWPAGNRQAPGPRALRRRRRRHGQACRNARCRINQQKAARAPIADPDQCHDNQPRANADRAELLARLKRNSGQGTAGQAEMHRRGCRATEIIGQCRDLRRRRIIIGGDGGKADGKADGPGDQKDAHAPDESLQQGKIGRRRERILLIGHGPL